MALAIGIFAGIFAYEAHAECQFSDRTKEAFGENCPKDVVALVGKMQACQHFEGEPFDLNEEGGRERKAFLDKRISELKCKTSKKELKMIKEKYKNDAAFSIL